MAQILIIDDDDLLRRVIAKALGHAGHTVIQAADGRQGIERFQATPIDLVITDLIMPVQEGVETILKLRREHPKLPIIAISGGANNSNLYLKMADKIGAQRILAKPFTPKELIAVIDELLSPAGLSRNGPLPAAG